METNSRILSIQSHVVRGYVGNKSACFPLQVLGFEVDAINSVQLSNHTKYNYFQGQILGCDQLEDVFDGLRKNELLSYSHLLTGYCSSESFLNKLVDIVSELKKVNPELLYLCDPVMGDDNKWYVPKSLLPILKEKMLPLSDIITPNQFEAELLSGVKINSHNDALKAINLLHDRGVKTVILSSYKNVEQDSLICIGSSKINKKEPELVQMKIPYVEGSFTGTGDLFSALILAWFSLTNMNLKSTLEKTINTIQAILKSTKEYSRKCILNEQEHSIMELRLIQNKKHIENPPTLLEAAHI